MGSNVYFRGNLSEMANSKQPDAFSRPGHQGGQIKVMKLKIITSRLPHAHAMVEGKQRKQQSATCEVQSHLWNGLQPRAESHD